MKFISKKVPKTIKNIPGSKSYIHRFLIGAFVLNKKITLTNVNFCEDVKATINCLKKLGAIYKITKTTIKFLGIKNKVSKSIILDCKESGSTLRMLLPIASYLHNNIKFIGKQSLFARPLSVYESILKRNNIAYTKSENSFQIHGTCPINDYDIDSSISSQFITGLLFLIIKTKTNLFLNNEIVSKNYIDISVNVLKQLGVNVLFENKILSIKSISQTTKNKFAIPADMSGLSNFLVLGALKGNLSININEIDNLQPDYSMIELLKSIGAIIKFNKHRLTIKAKKLKPINVNINNCIDLGPIIFVLASFIEGESKVLGTNRLKIKESDRLNCMITELNKIGVEVEVANDVLTFKNSHFRPVNNNLVLFNSHNDHRVAMALIIAAKIINQKCFIDDTNCLKKSFPNYLKNFK